MQDTLEVPARFRGPPESGNGGYVAGLLAEQIGDAPADIDNAAVEVTLRAPTPLDRQMQLLEADRLETDGLETDGQGLQLILGETLIAEARWTTLTLDIPEPPGFAAALAARQDSPSLQKDLNPFLPDGTGFHPICFCCGADVEPEEGLHVYPAAVAGFDGVAAAWQPSLTFADDQGYLPERILWAGLDCPGQFAYLNAGIRTGMLGRITGRMLAPVLADQELVIIGWCLEVERSKHFAGTALFDAQGTLCGYTRQVWIGRRD